MQRFAFHLSPVNQPHPERTRAILKAHPEVRGLTGRTPWTALIMVVVVAFQASIAAAMGMIGLGSWWIALIVAYAVGAFANHALYVVIHDATHNLIFRAPALNRLVAIAADLPNAIPSAIGFGVCHLQHHAFQGDYERDVDIANDWEARFVGNRWYGKALWLLLFPLFQLGRPQRLRSASVINRWSMLNLATALAFDALMVVFFGWNALVYLFASLFFSVGLHPLGARWIQEHYTLGPEQETGSYYGPLNVLALNVGYHNEHHDFPTVPWNRLPRIRAIAPEFYDTLKSPPSWPALIVQFVFDERYSLFSRVVREKTAPDFLRNAAR